MNRFLRSLTFFYLLVIVLSGCASPPSVSGSSTPDYSSTKKMVVDMLKSDEGKQALKDILKSPDFKNEMILNNDVVKQTIIETMTSQQGKQFWTTLVEDPTFSTKLAQAMQKENTTLLKQLMKDPTYQGSMMDILRSPDMEKNYLNLMKTKPFREQMQQAMIETMQSPLFTTQLEKVLAKVVKAEIQKEDQASSKGK
jgi:spore germination protein D